MANRYNLEVDAGDDFELTLTYKSGGTAVDLTGYTFEWYIAVGLVVETYTDAPQVNVDTDPTTGIIVLSLTAADTVLFIVRRGIYHFKVISPAGKKKTLLKGVVDVDY